MELVADLMMYAALMMHAAVRADPVGNLSQSHCSGEDRARGCRPLSSMAVMMAICSQSHGSSIPG